MALKKSLLILLAVSKAAQSFPISPEQGGVDAPQHFTVNQAHREAAPKVNFDRITKHDLTIEAPL